VEPVEAPAIGDELRALLFEDFPDRAFALLRMRMGLRPTTISWLQSNGQASPGAKLSGIYDGVVALECSSPQRSA
jgi:hypothetical protein